MVEPSGPTINPPKIQIMKSFKIYMLLFYTPEKPNNLFFPYAKF